MIMVLMNCSVQGRPLFSCKVGYLLRHLSILEQALAVSQGSANTCCPPVYVGDPNSISESKCTVAPEHVILLAEGDNIISQ